MLNFYAEKRCSAVEGQKTFSYNLNPQSIIELRLIL